MNIYSFIWLVPEDKKLSEAITRCLYIIKFHNQETENREINIQINHLTKQASQITMACINTIKNVHREADVLNSEFISI